MVCRQWRLAHGRNLELGAVGRIMGILNVTPDSFSDGGQFDALDRALAHASRMLDEGADIIDIGGESTRPGAEPVSGAAERARILPIIRALAAEGRALISVDTYRARTAEAAIEAGAHIVNDVWGLQREPDIAQIASRTGAGLVVMHTGRGREKLADPIVDQMAFLTRSLEIADRAGVDRSAIVLDPGFGFAKETTDENLDLILRLGELAALGQPLLVGTSRKRFLGAVTGREAVDRDVATAATSALLRLKGASLFRVHNVAYTQDALALADAMLARAKHNEERA